MNHRLTKEQARAWRDRWRLVNDFVIKEARAASIQNRLRDLEVLFSSADLFPAQDSDVRVDAVRRRWAYLREYCSVG